MRITFSGLTAMITLLPCLCFLGAGQATGVTTTASQVSKKIETMRHQADVDAKAIAAAAQAHAIKSGKYSNVMSDYALDLGGKLPINPCTGTRTGYTMVVFNNGKQAKIAATTGILCGKWSPKVFELSLKH
jgi:hypothetical protein